MLAFLKLYSINFWKTKTGPFFVFIFPFMMLAILGNIMPFKYLAAGILLLPIITIGTQIMPAGLAEFKGSKILKRVALTNVTKAKLIGALLLFNLMIMMIGTIISVISVAIFSATGTGNMAIEIVNSSGEKEILDMNILWNQIGISGVFISLGYATALALLVSAIGILLGFKSNDTMGGLTKGLLIYFPMTFLSGVFLDLRTIEDAGTMNTISKLLPTRWVIEPVIKIISGEGLSGVSEQWFLWVGPLTCIICATTLLYITVKQMEWND